MSSSGKISSKTPTLKGATVVVVRTEWNKLIVDKLFAGCKRILEAQHITIVDIIVPGAFEIPFTIKKYWDLSKKKRPDAFIALGCVIKGDTPHFEYVSGAVTDGIVQLNLILSVPVIFGVLTVNNEHQALERTGGVDGHKGEEAADTAIKMISISRLMNQ
jgi:6,7-dimethyl-8-ribityllumazine synthase